MDLNKGLENVNYNSMSKADLIKLVKELKEKKDLQESFLLNISHDLRSPVNVILSVLQCLKYEIDGESLDIDKKRCEYRDIIRRNSLKIIKLVDNLIDASKLEKNYYNLNKHNVEIISMIEGTVTSIQKYAEAKGICLIFDTNIEECICAVDPQAIDRIVMNLLSNAIKFSPRGSKIFVCVSISKKSIEISVEDQGVGIAKNEQKTIFNRFVQAKQTRKSEHSGSGIGLDLVNYLSEAHGGSVNIFSEEGKGSKFVVTLPIIKLRSDEKDYKLEGRSKVEQLEVEFSDIYL